MNEEDKKSVTEGEENAENVEDEEVDTGDGKNGAEIKVEVNGETADEPDPKDLLEAARKEADESRDRFLRASAELENYKKRTSREIDGIRKYAAESVIKQLLPVVDNLERAIGSANGAKNSKSDAECVIEGVELTLKETLKVFGNFGVKQIQSVGETFDPKYHEAIMREESEHPRNTVLKELQRGYMIHDRLLRPAMVVVSKEKTETEKDTDTKPSENNEKE